MTQTLKASEVGKVVKQAPEANSEAKMADGIVLWVSGGQKLLDVPTVTGKTQADAEKALKDAGLTATVSQGFSNTVVKGVVISQAPKPGQKVPSETSVGIVVSEGIQNINVVGVVGQTQANAVSSLKAQGLSVQVITDYAPSVAKGKVADQFPSAGTAVLPGHGCRRAGLQRAHAAFFRDERGGPAGGRTDPGDGGHGGEGRQAEPGRGAVDRNRQARQPGHRTVADAGLPRIEGRVGADLRVERQVARSSRIELAGAVQTGRALRFVDSCIAALV